MPYKIKNGEIDKMFNPITPAKLFNNLLMAVGFVILTSGSAKADFFDFLFGPEPCKAGTEYTCNELENAQYNVYFYSPDKEEKYIGLARNLATAKIISVQYANSLNLSRDSGWTTTFCLKTKLSECAEKH